ncbi:MAG TPA: SMI1/KNR4 family protein [Candidatus Limnocylindrales bacterium]
MSLLVVEAKLGRDLPAGLKRFYEVSDGAELVDGNLNAVPAIGPGEMLLLDYSEWLRDAEWPIPEEVLMFGGDGSDELFGLWYPSDAAPTDPTRIVEIAEIFEPGCMAIVGTDLPVFLRGRIAYHLAYYFESDPTLGPALEAIGLPRKLWERASTQQSHRDSMAPCLEWAGPTLPTKNPD